MLDLDLDLSIIVCIPSDLKFCIKILVANEANKKTNKVMNDDYISSSEYRGSITKDPIESL